MPTLREIIEINYCGIGEDINQVELAQVDWLKGEKNLLENKIKPDCSCLDCRDYKIQIKFINRKLREISTNKSKEMPKNV